MDENEVVKEWWEHKLQDFLNQKTDIIQEINNKNLELEHMNKRIDALFRIGKKLNIIQ